MSGDVPPPLAAHGCAVVGNMLYIFGGLDAEGTATDQLYALNTSVCIACVCALHVCVHVCVCMCVVLHPMDRFAVLAHTHACLYVVYIIW